MESSTKEWWGPRIWNILHSLAELSNRRDCMFLWKHILRRTADILPCEACRNHFHQRIPLFRTSTFLSSEEVRERIREFLWSAHQDVNGRLGKEGIPKETLAAVYTQDSIHHRIMSGVDELVQRFSSDNVLDRFHANMPILWKRDIQTLLHLFTTPEPPLHRGSTRTGRRM
jgi:hypothetical protein